MEEDDDVDDGSGESSRAGREEGCAAGRPFHAPILGYPCPRGGRADEERRRREKNAGRDGDASEERVTLTARRRTTRIKKKRIYIYVYLHVRVFVCTH